MDIGVPSRETRTDDICTKVNGADEVPAHAERVVDDKREPVVVRDLHAT
jgi:hypothetical protein